MFHGPVGNELGLVVLISLGKHVKVFPFDVERVKFMLVFRPIRHFIHSVELLLEDQEVTSLLR